MIYGAVISMILGAMFYCYFHESCKLLTWLRKQKDCVDLKLKGKICRKK
jgi:hypothetical protein